MSSTNAPNTFAEANVALHAKLMSALQAAATPSTAGSSFIQPTPLLVRVLRRTAVDFADVIVDGRCATGSRQVGSAAAIWVHYNAAVRSAGASQSTQSSPASLSAGAAAAAGSVPPSPSAAAAAAAGGAAVVPLFYTEAALAECRHLMVLYSFHCLLTAAHLYGHNASAAAREHLVTPAADGRVRSISTSAHYWAPEVAFIVAESDASAEAFFKLCKTLSDACEGAIQVTLLTGSKSPASLVLRPSSATAATSSSAGKDTEASKKEEAARKKGTEWPCAMSIIIATAQNFLGWNLTSLLNTGVDVAMTEEATTTAAAAGGAGDEGSESKDAPVKTKRVFPHVTSVVVEEIAGTTVGGEAEAKAIQQWRDVHLALSAAMPRQHPRYCAAAHLQPHVMWVCRGPVSRLPSALRLLLSRRSRRYYQLQPSTYISSAAVALMPYPQEGLSTPAESLGIRLVLSQNTADKDAQLRRIVTDRSGLFHRVVILTHNKEVPQLNALLTSWGVTREYVSNNASAGMTQASPNVVYSTRRMDSVAVQHQCQTSYLGACVAAEKARPPPASATATATGTSGNSTTSGADSSSPSSSSSPVVVSLVAWDAFTALDVMDVDVIVQYYPPQKSLTEQEWAEFIQLLHTTVDGEREIELSLRQNRNNKEDNIRAKLAQLRQSTINAAAGAGDEQTDSAAAAGQPAAPQRPLPVLVTLMVAADFTLSAYFVHQYLYSGASGTLTHAAAANSLASIGPAPGKPGVQEPVEHPLPVLDISPKHPYFIPLVCGHDGGANWPEGAAGSPPKPRVTPPGPTANDAPLLSTLVSGEPVTVRTVLAAKLAKEQAKGELARSPGGGSSAATSPTTAAAGSHSNNNSSSSATASPVGVRGNGSVGGNSVGTGNDVASNLARLVRNVNVVTGSVSPSPSGGGGSAPRPRNSKDGGGSMAEAGSSSTSGGGGGGAKGNANANASKPATTAGNAASGGSGKAASASPSGGAAAADSQSAAAKAAAAGSGAAGAAGSLSKNKRRQRSGRGGGGKGEGGGSGSNNNSGGNAAKKPAA